MHLFYAPEIVGSTHTLPESESKHAVRVLRLGIGDAVTLFDGKGHFYYAQVRDNHPKRCQVAIVRTQTVEPRPFSLHIAIAPTKNIARTEWFLEKATEIGIESITPIICQRSERKEVKTERLEKVVLAAAKQSMAAWLPTLHKPLPYNKFIAQPLAGNGYIAHCLSEQSRVALASAYKATQNAVVLIGPEGDFTPSEIEAATAAGFSPVALGETRLRTETAGLVACHTIALLNSL